MASRKSFQYLKNDLSNGLYLLLKRGVQSLADLCDPNNGWTIGWTIGWTLFWKFSIRKVRNGWTLFAEWVDKILYK